jgi:hypothetical protein
MDVGRKFFYHEKWMVSVVSFEKGNLCGFIGTIFLPIQDGRQLTKSAGHWV